MKKIVYEGKTYFEPAQDSQKLFEALNMHSFRYYPKDNLIILSDLCYRYFGLDKIFANAPESLVDEVTFPIDRDKHLNLYVRINNGEKRVSASIHCLNGKYYKVSLTTLESDKEGKPLVVAGVTEEFDEQMMSAEVTKMLSRDYISVYLLDFETDKIYPYRVSEHVDRKFGEPVIDGGYGRKVLENTIRRFVVPEELAEMLQVISEENIKAKLQEKNVYMHDFRVVIDGTPLYYRFKVCDMSEGEAVTRVVMGFADVSREKATEWKRLAYMDVVTGGYNIYYFKELLKAVDKEGYLVSLNIRSFKIVNSVCGLEKGDFILRTLSEIIAYATKDNGFYGHISADNFIMFFPTSEEKQVIDYLATITDEILKLGPRLSIPKITPYYGIARWKPGRRVEVAMSETNTASRNVKDDKKCNYRFYRMEDMHKAVEEKEIESSFDEAIQEREFEIWYQPKYNPNNNEVIGAEALVRWKRSNGELVSPGKFIPVFEKTGLIRELDEYVFRAVCYQQKYWLQKFGRIVPISVNLSRASLYYESVVYRYKSIVDEVGVSPEFVPVEITETATVNNDNIKMMTEQFHKAGFPLHMDDFGTGYSSLSTLNIMKFDTLKLDKSLIDYIGNYGGERLLHHTIALAKELGLHVTAEGVEKENQVDFLKELECDSIQGFYYAKPMPGALFEEKMKAM